MSGRKTIVSIGDQAVYLPDGLTAKNWARLVKILGSGQLCRKRYISGLGDRFKLETDGDVEFKLTLSRIKDSALIDETETPADETEF